MTEHTPGPWSVKPDNRAAVNLGDGVAIVCSQTTNGVIPSGEVQANARLIAAAPELLEALRNILDALDLGFHELALSKLNAHEAIAKATTPEQ